MTDNTRDEALAMLGSPDSQVSPAPATDAPNRVPASITFGMCRFYKDLDHHEFHAVKIRIHKNEKELLKAMCADMGVEYYYAPRNKTYEWNVYPMVSLRHAVRVVDVFKGGLSSLRDLNIGNAQYFDSVPQTKIGVIRSDKKRDEHGELLGESYIIVGPKTKCIKAFLKQDWPGIQWKKIGEDDANLSQAWVLPADRTDDDEITEYFASTFGFRVVFAVDNVAN